jgi:hypothetical protein
MDTYTQLYIVFNSCDPFPPVKIHKPFNLKQVEENSADRNIGSE